MLKSSRAVVDDDGVTSTVKTPSGFTLSVSEVASASGVAPSAVRFYEKNGLITAQRTTGDQRRFDDNAACRIKVARVAQRVGLTVREIADVLTALPDDPQPDDWARIADVLIEEAEARTAVLRAHLDEIRSGARLCEIDDQMALPATQAGPGREEASADASSAGQGRSLLRESSTEPF